MKKIVQIALAGFMEQVKPEYIKEMEKDLERRKMTIIYEAGWKACKREAIKLCEGNAEANAQVKPEFESGCRSCGRIIERDLG